jgi:hypothetical protein
MRRVDRSVAWRAGLLQAVALAAVAVVLGASLSGEFFESWGWLAGPGAWLACALLTATLLRLPVWRTLLGAAVAGLPSLATVLAGVHWAGTPLAVIVFGLWCGWVAARQPRAGRRVTVAA